MAAGKNGRSAGFTLAELMVTVAIAAILMMIAAPSFSEFVVRNKSSAIANEFMGSVLRARNMAVSSNVCTVMCVGGVDTAGVPACLGGTTTGWQPGWVIYRVPNCDMTTEPVAADAVAVVDPVDPDYSITASNAAAKLTIFFTPTGRPRATDVGSYELRYGATTRASNRTICLSALGRTYTTNIGTACLP